ncbi:MAG: ABC transporter ATP-binding protein, partial [Vicinamibacterales bacterium]
RTKLAQIGEFSGLGEFLNYPVRTYSAGMLLRLAFSVSTAITPEILLLDEVIAAGDVIFAGKAQQRVRDWIRAGAIVILASHALQLLREYCPRAIWLDKGKIVRDGPAEEVISEYLRVNAAAPPAA